MSQWIIILLEIYLQKIHLINTDWIAIIVLIKNMQLHFNQKSYLMSS